MIASCPAVVRRAAVLPLLLLGLVLAGGCATTAGGTTGQLQQIGERIKRETVRGNLFSYSNSREFPGIAFFGVHLARALHRQAAVLRDSDVTVRQGDYLEAAGAEEVTHTLALLPRTGYGVAIRLRYDPAIDRFHVISHNLVLTRDFH